MLIAQISDTHLVTEGPAAAGRARNLADATALIGSLDPAPELVLHSGDITHNGRPAEYGLARRLLDPLGLPVLAVPGNRDDRGHLMAAFPPPASALRRGPWLQFAADAGLIRIVAADTRHDASGLGAMDDDRLADLCALLDAARDRPTLVLLHHPPVPVPDHEDPLQFKVAEEGHRLAQAIAARPSVLGALAGHVHRQLALEISAVPVRIMPSIAVDLRRDPAPAAHSGRPIVHLHAIAGREIVTRTLIA